MMRRETLSPMPEPSVLVEKKGVKIFSVTSGGDRPAVVAYFDHDVFGGVYARPDFDASSGLPPTASRAFLSRLTATCPISALSA